MPIPHNHSTPPARKSCKRINESPVAGALKDMKRPNDDSEAPADTRSVRFNIFGSEAHAAQHAAGSGGQLRSGLPAATRSDHGGNGDIGSGGVNRHNLPNRPGMPQVPFRGHQNVQGIHRQELNLPPMQMQRFAPVANMMTPSAVTSQAAMPPSSSAAVSPATQALSQLPTAAIAQSARPTDAIVLTPTASHNVSVGPTVAIRSSVKPATAAITVSSAAKASPSTLTSSSPKAANFPNAAGATSGAPAAPSATTNSVAQPGKSGAALVASPTAQASPTTTTASSDTPAKPAVSAVVARPAPRASPAATATSTPQPVKSSAAAIASPAASPEVPTVSAAQPAKSASTAAVAPAAPQTSAPAPTAAGASVVPLPAKPATVEAATPAVTPAEAPATTTVSTVVPAAADNGGAAAQRKADVPTVQGAPPSRDTFGKTPSTRDVETTEAAVNAVTEDVARGTSAAAANVSAADADGDIEMAGSTGAADATVPAASVAAATADKAVDATASKLALTVEDLIQSQASLSEDDFLAVQRQVFERRVSAKQNAIDAGRAEVVRRREEIARLVAEAERHEAGINRDEQALRLSRDRLRIFFELPMALDLPGGNKPASGSRGDEIEVDSPTPRATARTSAGSRAASSTVEVIARPQQVVSRVGMDMHNQRIVVISGNAGADDTPRLTQRDLASLNPGARLNDIVIAAYLALLLRPHADEALAVHPRVYTLLHARVEREQKYPSKRDDDYSDMYDGYAEGFDETYIVDRAVAAAAASRQKLLIPVTLPREQQQQQQQQQPERRALIVVYRADALLEYYDSHHATGGGAAAAAAAATKRGEAAMRVVMRSGLLRRLGWTASGATAADDDDSGDDDVDSEWETRVAECAQEPAASSGAAAAAAGTESGAYMLWFAQCVLGDKDVRDAPPGNFRARVHHALRQLVVD